MRYIQAFMIITLGVLVSWGVAQGSIFNPTDTSGFLTSPVANSDLENSTVSYGGIQLSLGGSDATPAFDLQDATGLIESGLNADNSPSDNDILTFDSTGSNFAWITQNAGTDITADLEEDTHASEHDGRSTTANGEAIDADEELYAEQLNLSLDSATTTNNGAYSAEMNRAITITSVSCNSNSSSVSIQLDERTSPYTAGTDILNANLPCDTDGESTTTFANAGIAAGNYINMDIDSMASSTAFFGLKVYGTYDD